MKTTLLFSLALTTLVACGGGNGSSTPQKPKDPIIPAFIVKEAGVVTTFDELTSVSFSYTITGAQKNISVDVVNSHANAELVVADSIGLNGGKVTFSVADLVNDEVANVALTFTDGNNRSMTFEHTFTLQNTSGDELRARYQRYGEALTQWVTFDAEQLLFERTQRVALLLGAQDLPHIGMRYNDLVSQAQLTALLSQLDDTTSLFEQYDNGTITETLLNERFEQLQQATSTSDIVTVANETINVYLSATNGTLAPIDFNGLYVDPDSGVLSQFVGNTTLGDYANGMWLFSVTHHYLTDIVFINQAQCAL